MKEWHWLLLIIVGIVLTRIPVLGIYLRVVNTAIHEVGHALTALILRGEVYRIELFSDTSGTATTRSKNRFTAFLVSLSGYLFSSAMAYVLFWLIHLNKEYDIVLGLTILFASILILYVRNTFGVLWLLGFIALNGWFLYLKNDTLIIYTAYCYALVVLVDSVISAAVVFYASITQPSKSGDCNNLQKNAFLPAFFWGLIFVSFAGFMAWRVWINFLA